MIWMPHCSTAAPVKTNLNSWICLSLSLRHKTGVPTFFWFHLSWMCTGEPLLYFNRQSFQMGTFCVIARYHDSVFISIWSPLCFHAQTAVTDTKLYELTRTETVLLFPPECDEHFYVLRAVFSWIAVFCRLPCARSWAHYMKPTRSDFEYVHYYCAVLKIQHSVSWVDASILSIGWVLMSEFLNTSVIMVRVRINHIMIWIWIWFHGSYCMKRVEDKIVPLVAKVYTAKKVFL